MGMLPFLNMFPEVAVRETRTVTTFGDHELPPDEYAFLELYCVDPDCDCRRVMLNVVIDEGREHLATINHAFDEPDDDSQMPGQTFLDPLNRQSRYSGALLEIFVENILDDPAYRDRLERHYRMVKEYVAEHSLPVEYKIQEIIEAMRSEGGEFALETIRSAIEMRDKITPRLLELLQDVADRAEKGEFDDSYPDDNSHLAAMYLLAQFREKRAYPIIVSLFSHPGETPYIIASIFVTEDMARVLASVFDGNLDPIKRMVENPELDEFVRSSALRTLVELVDAGVVERGAVGEYLLELLRTTIEGESSYLWEIAAFYAMGFCPDEAEEDICRLCDEGLVDPNEMAYLEKLRKKGKDIFAEIIISRAYGLIDDAVDEMEWLYKDNDETEWPDDDLDYEDEPYYDEYIGPPDDESIVTNKGQIIRVKPKIGRNEPCPCGSGKKYKKCCLDL